MGAYRNSWISVSVSSVATCSTFSWLVSVLTMRTFLDFSDLSPTTNFQFRHNGISSWNTSNDQFVTGCAGGGTSTNRPYGRYEQRRFDTGSMCVLTSLVYASNQSEMSCPANRNSGRINSAVLALSAFCLMSA